MNANHITTLTSFGGYVWHLVVVDAESREFILSFVFYIKSKLKKKKNWLKRFFSIPILNVYHSTILENANLVEFLIKNYLINSYKK